MICRKDTSLRALFSWDLQDTTAFFFVLTARYSSKCPCTSLHFKTYNSLRLSTLLTLHLSLTLELVTSQYLETLPSNCYLILGYVLPWRSQKNKALRDASFRHSSSDHLRPCHCENLLRCSFCLDLFLEVWWFFEFQVKYLHFFQVIFSFAHVYFLLVGFLSDCLAIPLLFSGHLKAHKNMSHSVMFDWSSPSHLPLEPLVLLYIFISHLGVQKNLVHTNYKKFLVKTLLIY